jgi:hypothetical protein
MPQFMRGQIDKSLDSICQDVPFAFQVRVLVGPDECREPLPRDVLF